MQDLSELEVSPTGLQKKKSWRTKWQRLWLYAVLQIGCSAIFIYLGHKIKWWGWLPIYWIVVWVVWWCWNMRFKLEGFVFWTEATNISRWKILNLRHTNGFSIDFGDVLVYRIDKLYGDRLAISVIPFNFSKKQWRNRLQIFYFKGLVLLRILK